MTDSREESSREGIDPEIARAEAEIARAREEVFQSIVVLEQEVARVLDWRDWIRRKPILAMAGAFALGALVGSLGPSRRRRHR
jgi:hypothetical protein